MKDLSCKVSMLCPQCGNAPVCNVVAKFEGNPQIFIIDDNKWPFKVLEVNDIYIKRILVYLKVRIWTIKK